MSAKLTLPLGMDFITDLRLITHDGPLDAEILKDKTIDDNYSSQMIINKITLAVD